MVQKKGFSIGAFGVIIAKNKKVLLAKRRDYPLWNLPGGGVNTGENPNEAVKREVLEEIGAQVEKIKLCGVYFKKGRDEIVFTYLTKVKPFTFKPTDEALEINYFSVDRLPENLPESHHQRIIDALNFKDEIVPKVQVAGSSKRAGKH